MDAQAAQLALQFMERVQLTGAEVPAYVQAQLALQGEVAKASAPPQSPEFVHNAQPARAIRNVKTK